MTRFAPGAVLLAAVVSLGSLPAAAQLRQTPPSGVEYVSGGIGQTEAQRMKRAANDYSLALLFATPSGQYLADVDVQLKDSRGAAVLSVEDTGPMLLVNLPPGRYQVEAAYNGDAKKALVDIRSGSHRRIDLRWPAGPSEQDA
jgi:hypothetical protein